VTRVLGGAEGWLEIPESELATIQINMNSVDGYRKFLAVKGLPSYRFQGRTAIVPDEYAALLDAPAVAAESDDYDPIGELFDYQQDIAELAIRKRKYAVFADCGLGKTLIMMEYARHVLRELPTDKAVLIVSPLMVVKQTIGEAQRWYGDTLPIDPVRAAGLAKWVESGASRLGITNYDALTKDIPKGRIGALILDESSMLKSHYGKWAGECLRLGEGLEWKLALTGTPAPNDRIEYANHAVFLDAFPTVNSFLARFFINRGQTQERWEMKPHAIAPFYRALSHWCIFLANPATYGWKDNITSVPPINVHIHDVDMTSDQTTKARSLTGTLFTTDPGGIGGRAKLARLAKSGDSLKPAFIRDLIASWPGESTIVWCKFNDEQDRLADAIPNAASVSGSTPQAERERIIDGFKAGEIRTLITKPKILGFGLNLQVATRQVFSSLHDSYEEYYQAVKRSNRIGSDRPLNVHIPVTDVERPMVDNVLRKAAMVHRDTEEQERIFRGHANI
jgi:superfamily II DNA or RNA helicase